MDQMIQLQQQIQRLQQEINGISQVCNQLQQSEQSNALQLQQMTQKEMMASQGIRRIQQAASQLSQEINQISNIAQQIVNQVSPFQRGWQTTGTTPGAYTTFTGLTGQPGISYPQTWYSASVTQPGTGVFGAGQYGAFGQWPAQQGFAQQGFAQGQNLQNIGAVPPINLGAFNQQLHPYSQGYTPGQLGTGSQWGYASQAFSNPGANQFSTGMQGADIGQSPLASAAIMSPMTQGTGLGQSGMQWSSGLSASPVSAYTPYLSNQFGFR